MKAFRTTAVASAVLAAAVLGATTTTATADPGTIGAAPTDTAAMAAVLDGALDDWATVGYAFAISQNGQLAASGSGGVARVGSPGKSFTVNTRLEIASATKNLAAAAVLKLLEANGNTDPNTSIWKWLPLDFKDSAHPSWAKVTFRQLLAHESGMEQLVFAMSETDQDKYGTLYNELEWLLTKEHNLTVPAPWSYTNGNYALLRVLLPQLWQDAEPKAGVPLITSTNSGSTMLRYINERLLAPAGIAPTTCTAPQPGYATLAYDVANYTAGGTLFHLEGAAAEACGGHRGLFLSAMELTRWQAHLRHGTVVSPAVRARMDSGELGWDRRSNGAANAGMYSHSGDFTDGPREQHTCHAKFPNGVEASVVYNSKHPGGVHSCVRLENAYKAAS